MGVIMGGDGVTRFSYLEYQALMLCLAGAMCLGLLGVEIAMKRFQVLPVLFPGMFSVRERRLYFFDFDIRDVAVANKLREEAKNLVRMTLCVVMSYLWQRCVLETTQQVGTEFPHQQCIEENDCFASELHFQTLFSRQYKAVDCSGLKSDFARRVVVSCIRFVKPSAQVWLMHLAIAHSLTQLNLKCYEVLVWIAGNSKCFRRVMAILSFCFFAVFLGLFFGGVMSEFVSSWLSFVMSLSIPVLLRSVWHTGRILEEQWVLQAQALQQSIEEHLSIALADRPGMEENSVTRSRMGTLHRLFQISSKKLGLGVWSGNSSADREDSSPSTPRRSRKDSKEGTDEEVAQQATDKTP